jgi:VWFA-related protein
VLLAAGLLAGAVFVSVEAQQAPAATLKIVSPDEEGYASGLVLLAAEVQPLSARVRRVSFYADGRLVCEVEEVPFQCEWDAGAGINEHLIRVVAVLESGERLVQSVRTKKAEYTESVDVEVVQVTATVTDSGGRFIKGLPKDAFRVFEDRVPQRITHFASENVPLELVLAIDISGSMTDAFPAVKEAVKKFLAALPEGQQVTMLGFNNDILTLARRETKPAMRLRAIDRLQTWGGTALYDVLVMSLDQLGRQVGRKAVVIFTDGDDQSSHVTLQDVLGRVDTSDATLFLIGQGRAREQDRLKQVLDRLADVSGGRALYPTDTGHLDATFGDIVAELSNQYLLAYPPTNTKRDDAWRSIDVELPGYDYKVRARKGYRVIQKPGS